MRSPTKNYLPRYLEYLGKMAPSFPSFSFSFPFSFSLLMRPHREYIISSHHHHHQRSPDEKGGTDHALVSYMEETCGGLDLKGVRGRRGGE